ncbi:MAG: siderophore-interacting protein [Nocardioides sp.]
MSTRARQYDAQVLMRARISDHLVRLVLGGPNLRGFASTGVPDEWVGLVVPGQFQSRYYTVRSWDGSEVTIDVVIHDVGLVTEWAGGDCIGDTVTITEPKGSFVMPADAAWLILVGDLTALPAMARILRTVDVPTQVWAEVPDVASFAESYYFPTPTTVQWLEQPADGVSRLASVVGEIDWPDGEGYFWMAGESAQMRAIRKHLMRERRLPSTAYDVMGYWRGGATGQPRVVDPGPIWRAGRAKGLTDEQIWADYDEARTE